VKTAECIVIGGGIAGLSLAALLARSLRVTVIEGESAPGYHASGRSVAFAHFGLGEIIVRTLTVASLQPLGEMTGAGGAPVTAVQAALHIARADEAEALADLAAVHEHFGCDFDWLDGAGAQALVPVLKAGPDKVHAAIVDHKSLKLDTDAMLQRHLADLRAGGGELVTGARITAIHRTGDSWRIETAGEQFEAPLIVNAAGAWADEIARMAGCTPIGLEPRRRTVIGFDAPQGLDVARWPFVKTVGEGFYMLPEGSGRLLASSMDQTPSDPCDAAAEELDIAIAADRVMQATSLEIRRIAHSWAGLRSFAPDELPVVGPAKDAPGFHWFAGQGGYGFQTSPALARIGESAVLGTPLPQDLAALGLDLAMFAPARFDA
jgi:D-arginine dehydrogenase